MAKTVKTSISIPEILFTQAAALAQQLDISQAHLVELAVENFIQNYRSQTAVTVSEPDAQVVTSLSGRRPIINQGDIYWVQLEDPIGLEAAIPHPYVVLQDDLFNHSRIHTAVVCALTSNLKRANSPGNVLLDVGESNLPKQSVVEVSKVSTIDKTQLGEYIGSLTNQRIKQILAGMRFLQLSFFTH